MLSRLFIYFIVFISISILIYGIINSDKLFIIIGILLIVSSLLVKSILKVKFFYK